MRRVVVELRFGDMNAKSVPLTLLMTLVSVDLICSHVGEVRAVIWRNTKQLVIQG
jgi:hypothetical protein